MDDNQKIKATLPVYVQGGRVAFGTINGQLLPLLEDHVGEELVGEPCQAEVTQEHIRQLREMIILQQHALVIVQRALFDLLPNQDGRVLDLADLLDVELPWIK